MYTVNVCSRRGLQRIPDGATSNQGGKYALQISVRLYVVCREERRARSLTRVRPAAEPASVPDVMGGASSHASIPVCRAAPAAG